MDEVMHEFDSYAENHAEVLARGLAVTDENCHYYQILFLMT